MFHHIRKFSSTTAVKAATTSPSPISAAAAVLYPTKNKEVEISLRPFQVTDVDDIMAWETDEQLSRFMWWVKLGLKGKYTCREEALDDIENHMIPHPWCKAICLNKNQQLPIGKICVHPYPDEFRFIANLSYVVASEHWDKEGINIATTAVKMALDTVFKEWPHLLRLVALVDVEKLDSQRVLEKAGFLKEAVHRKFSLAQNGRIADMATFSFLSTDFKDQQLDLD